jgi:pimeloyl-ACP methyl ester carboxylesterase
MSMPGRAGAVIVLALLLLPVTGCSIFAPTVAVDEAGVAKVYASLNANALNSDELSTATREVLHAYGLAELGEDDPRAALHALHEVALRNPSRVHTFALAELAFFLGRDEADRDAFLAASLYAYLYLFGTEDPVPPNPYDRRFRWACDLYNTALQQGLATPGGKELALADEQRALPVGSLHLSVDWSAFPWTVADYPYFVPGDRFLIEGLSVRMRDSGLGMPLIGIPAEGSKLGKTPATAFLRVRDGLAEMADGLDARLELHSAWDAQTVEVAGSTVPLESDLSVVLAYALHQSPIWKLSLSGLFEGERAVKENLLRTIRPHQPGRIPVVFVHGTASNPAYWAEMFNTLIGDPRLRREMQFWFFQYTSGNPILYTAATLREQLALFIAEIDPEGKDPALKQMVLIGHSQGGLVVRLMATDGSLAWLEEVSSRKVEDFGFDEEQMALMRRVYEFDPSPYVARMVFVSTPHRGSFEAAFWYTRWIAKLIALPGEVQGLGSRMFKPGLELPPGLGDRIPTSLDNMNPDSPLLKVLAHTPMAAGIPWHSIIPIGDADPDDAAALAEADDGIVTYASAHMDGAESELLLPGGHSCQSEPPVIQEVRRILHEHLDKLRRVRR